MSDQSDMDIREHLSAYIDGELSDRQTRRVDAALADDDALQAELDELRHTRRLVAQLPRQHAPDDFVQQVLAEVERNRLMTGGEPNAETATPRRYGWVRYVASAAVVLIVASVALVVTSNLWNPSNFIAGHPEDTARTPDKNNAALTDNSENDPPAPESLGWAPQLVVISSAMEPTAGAIETSLAEAGLVPVDQAEDAENNPALYEWIERTDNRRELAIYYRHASQRQAIENRIAVIRRQQTVVQANRWSRPVQLHVRRETLAGRDVARFARRGDRDADSLGPFLQEHWAHLTLPLRDAGDAEDWTDAVAASPFREKTPEQEAADLFRHSMVELREEHGLSGPHSVLEPGEGERRRIDRMVEDSLAELHRRPVPTSRSATNSAASADMKIMLISIVSDSEARRLASDE
ncbi:MAG: anti-sigma factor family protein [Phycisphaerae bacterium]